MTQVRGSSGSLYTWTLRCFSSSLYLHSAAWLQWFIMHALRCFTGSLYSHSALLHWFIIYALRCFTGSLYMLSACVYMLALLRPLTACAVNTAGAVSTSQALVQLGTSPPPVRSLVQSGTTSQVPCPVRYQATNQVPCPVRYQSTNQVPCPVRYQSTSQALVQLGTSPPIRPLSS